MSLVFAPTDQHIKPTGVRSETQGAMGGDFNMHTIKRKAHREAWYGNSLNPFRRTRTNLDNGDVESGPVGSDVMRVESEPLPRPPTFQNSEDAISPSTMGHHSTFDSEKVEMTTGRGDGPRTEQTSEETAVNSQSTGRPPSEEHSARQRTKFRKNKGDDPDPSRSNTSLAKTKSSKSLKHKPFTLGNQLRATIFNSWINLLILAAPVGIALHFVNISPVAVFVINFIAIVPLAALLSYATEEISLRVGETLGGLLNATFGNAVELIVSVIALIQKEYLIVKTSLIGSMLSNLLLVMGMCFFFGGLRRDEQFFNVTVAQTAASLLALAIGSIIIPTVFDTAPNTGVVPIAAISRGTAVILLIVYGCYLYFQLKTHAAMYNAESQKVAMRPSKKRVPSGSVVKRLAAAGGLGAAQGRSHPLDFEVPPGDELLQRDAYERTASADKEEDDEPQLHIWVAVFTLAASTVVIALCAEFMVDSISSITSGDSGISAEFVGLILLPIVGNAAEHATAVTVAVKDKMDLAIGVAVGSSMQIALLVLPLIVVLGWILGHDEMNLSFDNFQIAVLFVAVLLVNYLIADGKSHWLEGALLQALYIIIAVTAWFYPKTSLDS